MQLHVDEQVRDRIPGVLFGCAVFSNVQVREADTSLWGEIDTLCQRLSREYTLDRLSEFEPIAAVRSLQRALGFDPTRYRPSSEALLRRVLKGQGLYHINTAVDVNNLCSLEYLIPMCVYDLRHLQKNLHVRIGGVGESYPGIGRQTFTMEQKVLIADDSGIVGNTVSDSERTKVTTATTDMLMLLHVPASYTSQQVEIWLDQACQRVVRWNSGELKSRQIVKV